MYSKIYLFLFLRRSQGSEKHFAIFQVSFIIIPAVVTVGDLKKLLLNISQYSQENNCVEVSFY